MCRRIETGNEGSAMSTAPSILQGQRGLVLVVGLMFLGILCVLGLTGAMLTTTDLKISANHKESVQSTYSAIAGHAEARARLGNGSIAQAGSPDASWRAFIGDATFAANVFGYDSTNPGHHIYPSIQSDLTYVVMIRHQVDGSGNVLLWGDSDGDYVFEENLTTGDPIEIVTSCGSVGSARKKILVELKKEAPFYDPPAALYVNGNLDKNGASGEAVGNYNAACVPVPDIVTTINAGACPPPWHKTCEASDWPAGTSNPTAWLVDDEADVYPVAAVLDQLASIADNMVPPGHYTNPTGWGSFSSPNEITYCNGNLSVNNLTGYGILVVSGDLVLKGNISWYGIMLVRGPSSFSGGGHVSVYGAVVADTVVEINGQPDIYYDCNVIDTLEESNGSYQVVSWTEYPDLTN